MLVAPAPVTRPPSRAPDHGRAVGPPASNASFRDPAERRERGQQAEPLCGRFVLLPSRSRKQRHQERHFLHRARRRLTVGAHLSPARGGGA
jgi:hypothetical protein